MTVFFVGLKNRNTYHRGNIGPFAYDPALERHVWQGEKTADAGKLAELVNGAYLFLHGMDNPALILEVVKISLHEPKSEQPNDKLTESPNVENSRRGRPRRASTKPAIAGLKEKFAREQPAIDHPLNQHPLNIQPT